MKHDYEHTIRQADAEQRRCPTCDAPPGQWCLNPKTGQPYRGHVAHIARMKEDG